MTVRDEALARDRAARRLAQSELDRPVALEAGAGTGKTTTLVARVLAWCLGAGWERAAERQAERQAERRARFGLPAGEPPDDERIAAAVLGGVVAITFTEAAAAEMASRIGKELAAVARRQPWPRWLETPRIAGAAAEPEIREICARRARALSAALDHLTVRTIHAWCLSLLTAHPLEAALHPRLTVDADGRRLEEIVHEVVETRLAAAYGAEPDEDILALAEAGVGPAEIVEALTHLVAAGLPAGGLAADPLAAGPVAALVQRLEETAQTLDDLLAPRLASGSRLDKAQEVAAFVAALRERSREPEEPAGPAGRPDLAQLAALLDWVRDAAAPVEGRLGKWARGDLTQAESGALAEAAGAVGGAAGELKALLAHLGELDLPRLGRARRALAPLLDEVRGEMRRRGIVTFQDLLDHTANLLARRPQVASRVRRRIDQLLVDEFQDTDPVQCEILRRIALEGSAAQRPGLFLVGDPKQSIYGWRSADLAAYESFLGELRRAGGEVAPLAQNFRSVPAVLDEVARLVEPVMRPATGLQPAFEPLIPSEEHAHAPGFCEGGSAPVEHWISWRRDDGGEPGRERTRSADADLVEAAAIARDLRRLHDEHGVAWGQTALLFRATTQLETYLAALRELRVPFVVSGDKQYYRRREIIEAAALVRAVIDPGDHVALLTLLRSSLVGVPDAALIPLWRRGLPRRVTELGGVDDELPRRLDELEREIRAAAGELPRGVPGLDRLVGWEASLLAALEHLAHARCSFRRDPGDLFAETLRRLFLPEAVEAARYLGAYRLANLERFFRGLSSALAEGEGDAAGLLRWLRRSVAEALEAPEGLPQHGAEDAVRVLTIHGAKGLEFDHVYLPQLHRGRGRRPAPATQVARRGEGFEMRLLGAPTLGFDQVTAERQAVEAAERVRLLYVAATRAKKRLVTAGRWPARVEAKPAEAASSLLDLLLSRRDLPGEPAVLWEELSARGESVRRDPAGALWRLPALAAAEEPGAREKPETPPPLPTPETVARDANTLARRREAASRRAARRRTATASEEAHHRMREQAAEAVEGVGEAAEGEPAAAAASAERSARLAVGTAVHALLEHLDPRAEPREELARLGRRVEEDLARWLAPEERPAAQARAEALLARLAAGPLLERLRRLAPSVLARELPVLLPPGGGPDAPVGPVVGTVDLLYLDPESGEMVVADYKTDAVGGEEELAARARVYAPQGEVYVRAVQEALALPRPPRFELWFLDSQQILTV